jgi:hypothetical protein
LQRPRIPSAASWNGAKKANETSERQWDDVTRLIRLLGSPADLARLTDMARSVGVDDLLHRLLNENTPVIETRIESALSVSPFADA